MKKLRMSKLLLLALLCLYSEVSSGVTLHLRKEHVCTRIEYFSETLIVPLTKRVKESYKAWCFGLPPRCTDYRYKTVTFNQTLTVNKTRIAYDCCKGYEKIGKSCVPMCKLGCGHGTCIEPDTCLCHEGWREPYCLNECEPNRFGKGCKDNCTCFHGATCDRKTGFCYCTEGYTGTYCEEPCPENTYGMHCNKTCECQNGGLCDIKDGTCDCLPGYIGENCEQKCKAGTHGHGCEKPCACLTETTASCNHINGTCNCKPGFKGLFCEKECDNFTYGFECENKCNCVNSFFCDPVNGRCACKPGWKGDNCSLICPFGTFGGDCKFNCPVCHNSTATCNHVNGSCVCTAGRYGLSCEKELLAVKSMSSHLSDFFMFFAPFLAVCIVIIAVLICKFTNIKLIDHLKECWCFEKISKWHATDTEHITESHFSNPVYENPEELKGRPESNSCRPSSMNFKSARESIRYIKSKLNATQTIEEVKINEHDRRSAPSTYASIDISSVVFKRDKETNCKSRKSLPCGIGLDTDFVPENLCEFNFGEEVFGKEKKISNMDAE